MIQYKIFFKMKGHITIFRGYQFLRYWDIVPQGHEGQYLGFPTFWWGTYRLYLFKHSSWVQIQKKTRAAYFMVTKGLFLTPLLSLKLVTFLRYSWILQLNFLTTNNYSTQSIYQPTAYLLLLMKSLQFFTVTSYQNPLTNNGYISPNYELYNRRWVFTSFLF